MVSQKIGLIITAAALLFNLMGCSFSPKSNLLTEWYYTDLLSLDPSDTENPDLDLVALYARKHGGRLEIRIDLLESTDFQDIDLYLAIDSRSGGSHDLPIKGKTDLEWENLISIPSHGEIQIEGIDGAKKGGLGVLVVRSPEIDAILVEMNANPLQENADGLDFGKPEKMQIFITHAGSSDIADQSEPVSFDGFPPPRANVIFAFWESYNAYSPATALRRWDGAHTGPNGGRHGLFNLLRTARSAQIPLFLLDLKEPASLAALDFIGNLDLVRGMVGEGLLELPLPIPDERFGPFKIPYMASEIFLSKASETAKRFGLPEEKMVFSPMWTELKDQKGQLIFTLADLPTSVQSSKNASEFGKIFPFHAYRWRDNLVFPLYDYSLSNETDAEGSQQTGLGGLTTVWKRLILQTAFSESGAKNEAREKYLNLGGALPGSRWGDPQAARAGFAWLKSHPWVKILGTDDLKSMNGSPQMYSPAIRQQINLPDQSLPSNDLVQSLKEAPKNSISEAAWNAYRALFSPIYPYSPELPKLRSEYIGQVWSLLEAAKWAENPITHADCNSDPDRDGEVECILASESTYTIFEIDNAELNYLFIRGNDQSRSNPKSHQIIGPSSQFISGLSSPELWSPGRGLASDPAIVSGAFSIMGSGFEPTIEPNKLNFHNPEGIEKEFRLRNNGIEISIQQSSANKRYKPKIPLAIDTWHLQQPGWAKQYTFYKDENELKIDFVDGDRLIIFSMIDFSVESFQQPSIQFSLLEDPNADHPPGFYQPYPLLILETPGSRRSLFIIEVLHK